MAERNVYGPTWYAATAVASPLRPPLSAETDVDVCVIGGGLAGLTAAREIARRGWSVLLLEARQIAWSSSGRSSGFVRPGFAADPRAVIARVGLDRARRLWALSQEGVEYVRHAIAECAMPGVEPPDGGWLRVSKTGGVAREAEVLAALGAEVEVWPAARVREQLRSPRYFDALHDPRAFAVHPLNYALGLAAAAESHGARIHEGTEALQIDPVGVRKRIATADARVRAGHVVLAGNVHLGGLMPQFASTLLTTHRYVVVTEPLGSALHDAIRFPGAISDTGLVDDHYRTIGGDRLLWSGRSTVWRGNPKRYAGTLLRDLARTYPTLGKVRAEQVWTGAIGNTVHGMPQIGEISPGLWLLSGFGDHGLNTAAMGGELIARAIVDGDRTLQAFEPFEMVWAGGRFGRVAQQTLYWMLRSRERAEGLIARVRHRRTLPKIEKRARSRRLQTPPQPGPPMPRPDARVAPHVPVAEPLVPPPVAAGHEIPSAPPLSSAALQLEMPGPVTEQEAQGAPDTVGPEASPTDIAEPPPVSETPEREPPGIIPDRVEPTPPSEVEPATESDPAPENAQPSGAELPADPEPPEPTLPRAAQLEMPGPLMDERASGASEGTLDMTTPGSVEENSSSPEPVAPSPEQAPPVPPPSEDAAEPAEPPVVGEHITPRRRRKRTRKRRSGGPPVSNGDSA